MIVVSDTTPLISLMKLNKLDLLEKIFGEIHITTAVYSELVNNLKFKNEAIAINKSKFIKRVHISNIDLVEDIQKSTGLDIGESEAIVYSQENMADILLMDEIKGRRVAKSRGLNVIGTIGVLLIAIDNELCDKEDVKQSLGKLKEYGIRISDRLYEQTIQRIDNKN